jgi:hypothetical protein
MLSKIQFFNFLSILFISIGMTACGGGDTQGTGTLAIGITDAPVDSAEAVVIHFTEATLHGPDGNTIVKVTDPVTGDPGRSIDLLQLQGGMWTGLFTDVVTAGQYSWIRLTLDLTQSYIQINGQQYALRCTSCENNGYRLNRSFNVAIDGTMALMLDFDLRKSITDPSSGLDYILRPTVRVVETAASGVITGKIDSTLIANLGGFTGCSVYAFAGNDALLDDVYIPIDMAIPAEQNNPVSTAKVVFENNIYQYTLSFLPAGDYTVALTCDADMDSAATDDTLTFSDPVNVTVIASKTSNGDINL